MTDMANINHINQLMPIEKVQDITYSMYQLDWMQKNGKSLSIYNLYLINIIASEKKEISHDESLKRAIKTFSEIGFDGECFHRKDEFLETEFKDRDYIVSLLNKSKLSEKYNRADAALTSYLHHYEANR